MVDVKKLSVLFEDIIEKNPDISINTTKLNNAISSFDTYQNTNTQILFRFFELGYGAGKTSDAEHLIRWKIEPGDLSRGTINRFKRAGITNISQLRDYLAFDRSKGIGRKAINEARELMSEMGYEKE